VGARAGTSSTAQDGVAPGDMALASSGGHVGWRGSHADLALRAAGCLARSGLVKASKGSWLARMHVILQFHRGSLG